MPNKYPAFAHHEVVIHVPWHARSLAELAPDELRRVARCWKARSHAAREAGFPYVQALVNEGRDAGASLAHSHSQLVWLESVPPAVEAEILRDRDGCALCELIESEREAGDRVVAESAGVVVLAPSAGRAPYELLIAPLAHEVDGFASGSLGNALVAAGDGARRIHACEGAVPLNLWLHEVRLSLGLHWHLELVPRLTIPASLELGAGIYINTLAPEEAARRLRDVAT